MNPSPSVAHYLDTFGQCRDSLPGGDRRWLRQIRDSAITRFADLGFPDPRDEDWKYTRLAALEKARFRPLPPAVEQARGETGGEFTVPAATGCCRLVFVDGKLSRARSTVQDAGEGVLVTGLREAFENPPEGFENHFGRHADRGDFTFAALNTAFVEDGAFIHLRRRASARHPIHLVFVSTGREPDIVSHPRVLVVADVASRASVVEHHLDAGNGARCFNNAVSEIVLKAGACVEHYKAQIEGDQTFHIANMEVHQAQQSHFTSHLVSLGGRLVRHDINVRMDEAQARCDLHGLYFATGRQHMDFHTRIDHLHPECTSNEVYKGVLDGRARGVFNGRVFVHPGAWKSDAHQSNANLLLSPHVEVDTKPQLEIHADDVKCSHGATVGQLDERMVFYLRSRGIEETSARALLTFGFLQEMLEQIPIPGLRESLASELATRMPHAPHPPDMAERTGAGDIAS